MKISAVSGNTILYGAVRQNKEEKKAVRKERCREFITKNKTYLEAGAASIVIGGIFWAYHGCKGKYTGAVNGLNGIKGLRVLNSEIKRFAEDIPYRKDLIKGIGGKESDYVILRSVIGPGEYKSIVKEFSDTPVNYSPGAELVTDIKDGFDMSGKISQKYRANLHIHTNHSDGRMSVAELLDQSAKYADTIAANLKKNPEAKAKNAPFTIAITDHDILEGCKEAVKIIQENPEKYKNLRVVMGCELTVENQLLEREMKKPVSIHLLLHGINPFDEKLNAYLNTKKANRMQLVKDIISQSSDLLAKEYPETAAKLSYDEAKLLCAPIEKGLLHVDGHTRDYVYYRTMFTELFEKNSEIQKMLAAKGLNPAGINYLSPGKKYLNELSFHNNGREWEPYKDIIERYTAELLGIKKEEVAAKMVLPSGMEKIFREISSLAADARPRLKSLQPAYIDMEEFINFFKNQQYGYMSIAHPGLINIGQALKHTEESIPSMFNMFKKFKEHGGEKAFCAELYYHYFGEVGKSKKWLNKIDDYARAAGLTPSGGLDSHGKSIFYSDI